MTNGGGDIGCERHQPWGYHVDHDIAAAVAIPVIAVLVSLALKRVRRKIGYHRQ